MRLSIGSALIAVALGASGAATAQSGGKSNPALATVESVQLSASVERGKATFPLAPGMELKGGDRVNTGAKSRLIVRLADGSTIKLGEQGSIFFDRMGLRDGKVFEAVIFAAEGAFRLAVDKFVKSVADRELSVAVNAVNVGVHGADLWGKSTSDSQIASSCARWACNTGVRSHCAAGAKASRPSAAYDRVRAAVPPWRSNHLHNSSARRDFPIPASPRIITTWARPRAASLHALRSCCHSPLRPWSGSSGRPGDGADSSAFLLRGASLSRRTRISRTIIDGPTASSRRNTFTQSL